MPRRLAACLVVALAASLARAGDEPGKPAPAGFNCRVTLTNGRTMTRNVPIWFCGLTTLTIA